MSLSIAIISDSNLMIVFERHLFVMISIYVPRTDVNLDLFPNVIFISTLTSVPSLALHRQIKCYVYTHFWFKFVSGNFIL